jgi:hypothetical protein
MHHPSLRRCAIYARKSSGTRTGLQLAPCAAGGLRGVYQEPDRVSAYLEVGVEPAECLADR